jgi:cytochrome c5
MRLQYGMKLAVAIPTFALAAFALSGNCFAAEPGEEIYPDKCVICQDAAADKAPRNGVPEDWKARPEDVAIAGNVRDALERAHILGVRVECSDGAVVLTGVAEDPDAVRAAVAAARAVPGVREVENRVSPAAVFQ